MTTARSRGDGHTAGDLRGMSEERSCAEKNKRDRRRDDRGIFDACSTPEHRKRAISPKEVWTDEDGIQSIWPLVARGGRLEKLGRERCGAIATSQGSAAPAAASRGESAWPRMPEIGGRKKIDCRRLGRIGGGQRRRAQACRFSI